MVGYSSIYRMTDGHVRVPFASLGTFLRVQRIRVSVAEARAIFSSCAPPQAGGRLGTAISAPRDVIATSRRELALAPDDV
jgi:hypothetical protein